MLGVTPRPGESLVGFVFRLAERIGMSSGRSLGRQAGFGALTNRPSADALAGLAEIAGLDISELEAISYGPPDNTFAVFRGCRIPFPLLSGSYFNRKICPACMSASAYHRSHWDLACVSICTIHALHLVSRCPSCGKDLLWGASSLCDCKCGHGRLAGIATAAVPRHQLAATKAVLGLLGNPRHAAEAEVVASLPPFQDLSRVEIVEFLFRMGLDIRSPRGKLFSIEWVGDHLRTAHEALASGLEVGRNWPSAFHQAIDQRRRSWGPTSEGARRRCISAIRRWVDNLPEGHGRAIATCLDDYGVSSLPIPPGFPPRTGLHGSG